MLTYETAKQLKDAGFPQDLKHRHEKGQFSADISRIEGPIKPGDSYRVHPEDLVYIPTLSELVESCGDEFRSLRKEGDIYYAVPLSAELLRGGKSQRGLSPEEAIANLWLELNKK